MFLRRGQYSLTNSAAGENAGSLSLAGEADPEIQLNLASDLKWTGDLELDGIRLTRANASGKLSFEATARDTSVVFRNCTVDIGVIRLATEGVYQVRAIFDNVRFVDGAATDATNGLELTGLIFASFRNCTFASTQATLQSVVSIQDAVMGRVSFSGCFWDVDYIQGAGLQLYRAECEIELDGCSLLARGNARSPLLSATESHVNIRGCNIGSHGGIAAVLVARGEVSDTSFFSMATSRVAASMAPTSVLVASGYETVPQKLLALRRVTVQYGGGYNDNTLGSLRAPVILGATIFGGDNEGVVAVDGLFVSPIASEVPAGETVVLRGTLRSGASNVYRNITVDYKGGIAPPTPSSFSESSVAIFGGLHPRSCLVENLAVLGLAGLFMASVNRRLIDCTGATLRGLSIEGAPGNSGGSLSAYAFTRELVRLTRSHVSGVQMFSQSPILCSGAALIWSSMSVLSDVSLNLEAMSGDVTPSSAWVHMNTAECVLNDARITALKQGMIPLVLSTVGVTVTNCLLQGGTDPPVLLDCDNATGGHFHDITAIATVTRAGVRLVQLASPKTASYCATNILCMSTSGTVPEDAYLNNARSATDKSGVNTASRRLHF